MTKNRNFEIIYWHITYGWNSKKNIADLKKVLVLFCCWFILINKLTDESEVYLTVLFFASWNTAAVER